MPSPAAQQVSEPIRHHYVPRAHLARWCGADGKLWRFSWAGGKLIKDRCSPKGTAFEPRLYSLDFKQTEQQILEQKFFAKVDDIGARLMGRVLSGQHGAFNPEELQDWAVYVLAQFVRTPDKIKQIQILGEQLVSAHLETNPQQYEALRAAGDPATLTEWTKANRPGLLEKIGMAHIPDVIHDEQARKDLLRMRWAVCDFKDASVDLIISDRPLYLVPRLDSAECLIYLPLSPTCGFFASPALHKLEAVPATALAKRCNEVMVAQAAKHVYARSDSHKRFIEARLQRPSGNAGAAS